MGLKSKKGELEDGRGGCALKSLLISCNLGIDCCKNLLYKEMLLKLIVENLVYEVLVLVLVLVVINLIPQRLHLPLRQGILDKLEVWAIKASSIYKSDSNGAILLNLII